ncbi:hypothetical protein O4159_01950 [Gordonia terrae]|uniref:hypothetical protein n=1 Tax=Gordonia hongkongensis TaxID=1701090 RepID=UPI0022B5D6AD|nr:hypothetical protein [Gordonia terrae]
MGTDGRIRVLDHDIAKGDRLHLTFRGGTTPDGYEIEFEFEGARDVEVRRAAIGSGGPVAFFFPGLGADGTPLPGGDFEPIIAAVVAHHEDGTPMVRADDIPYYLGRSSCRCTRCIELPVNERASGVVFEYPLTGLGVVHVYAHGVDGSPEVCVDDLPGYGSCITLVTPSDTPSA